MSDNKELIRIKNRLKGKVLIVGMGNPLRGDDGVGPEIIRRLKRSLTNLPLFDVGEVPENYLEKIVKEKPDTIVLIDATEVGSSPGEVRIIERGDVEEKSLFTHDVSLNIIAQYLQKETSADVFFIGIQPKSTKFGRKISKPVRKGLRKVVKLLERTSV